MNTHAVTEHAISIPQMSVGKQRAMKGASLGVIAATIATTVVYAIGNAGANIQVVTGWAPDGGDLRYVEVVVTAAVAIVLGAGLLRLMQRRVTNAFRIWAMTAAAVAVLSSVPLWRLEVDTGSKLALTLMHLATGASAVGAQAVFHVKPSRS
jgi:hypothetical protein